MSRLLNTVNPNDLLAKQVINIAKYNRTGAAFVKAVSTFGKFSEDTMLNLHTRILTHLSITAQHSPPRMFGGSNAAKEEKNVDGMIHDNTDILAAEPKRKGGLTRSGGDVSKDR
jgi:pre-mRNA-splicing factor ATP-dependent RNA helicase DHX38/PRP16